MRTSLSSFFQQYYLYAILGGIVLLYLPHLPRFFFADDWLWLDYGQAALADPLKLIERSVYGYYRPLYVLYMGLLHALFGLRAFPMALANLGIHLLNCILLRQLLVRLGADRYITMIATLFFGFYFLSCTSVAWLSAGCDLAMLACLLGCCLAIITYYDHPSTPRWLLVVLLGMAATLCKENGLAWMGLFIAYPFLKGGEFRRRAYTVGILGALVVVACYLVFYFATRVVVEKELLLSWDTPMHLWYLSVYLFVPLSRRFVAHLDNSLKLVLLALRSALVLAIPVMCWWVIVRKKLSERFFLVWLVFLLLPIALFDWGVGLFDLYPDLSASRFMYGAVPAVAVIVGIVGASLLKKVARPIWFVLPVLAAGLVVDFVVVEKVTALYRYKQETTEVVFRQLVDTQEKWSDCDNLIIGADDSTTFKYLFGQQPEVLERMCYFACGRRITIQLDANEKTSRPWCRLRWITDKGRFEI